MIIPKYNNDYKKQLNRFIRPLFNSKSKTKICVQLLKIYNHRQILYAKKYNIKG